jgi:hypothetical protein
MMGGSLVAVGLVLLLPAPRLSTRLAVPATTKNTPKPTGSSPPLTPASS